MPLPIRKAALARSFTDYKLTMGQMQKAGWTEKQIRAEYTRLRDITQKRLIQMHKKGETDNFLYERYGTTTKTDRKGRERLAGGVPEAKGKTTAELLADLQTMAYAIGVSKKSTVRDIREAREKEKRGVIEAIESRKKLEESRRQRKAESEGEPEIDLSLDTKPKMDGDIEVEFDDSQVDVEAIKRSVSEMTSAEWKRFGSVMRMLQPMIKAKQIDSPTVITNVQEMVTDRPDMSPASIFLTVAESLSDNAEDFDAIMGTLERYDANGNLLPEYRRRSPKKGR